MALEQFESKRKELGVAAALELKDVEEFRPPVKAP